MPRTAAPDLAVCTALDDVTGVDSGISFSFGKNLFRGPVREPSERNGITVVPHECVFVLTTGGEAPIPYKDRTVRDELIASVSVYVRGEPDKFENGQELARDIWFALEHEGLDGYIECQCTESEPRYMGPDDSDHHRWLITLRLRREEAIA